jgi:hypothetical protein
MLRTILLQLEQKSREREIEMSYLLFFLTISSFHEAEEGIIKSYECCIKEEF